ncbi:MAG: flagellar biosynthesis anti-sigma factor FlgM [Kangiellaceae bacterium]|nr:flagellar biosynthesis anti-sigma factor FlgM [Kangiellaceae bacterium]
MVLDVRNLVPGQTKALLGKTDKSKKKAGTSSAGDSVEVDSVVLTGQANKISQLINQMKAEPAVNPDRVSPVKDKLTKGEFEIDYEQVANKMLDFESSYYGY